MYLSADQVKNYLRKAGFSGQALNYAVQIAQCESSFNTKTHNTSGEDSRGLMQINVSPEANPQYKSLDLFDPQVNANVAYKIFKAWGSNFGAWTCATKLGLVNPSASPSFNLASLGILLATFLYLKRNYATI